MLEKEVKKFEGESIFNNCVTDVVTTVSDLILPNFLANEKRLNDFAITTKQKSP